MRSGRNGHKRVKNAYETVKNAKNFPPAAGFCLRQRLRRALSILTPQDPCRQIHRPGAVMSNRSAIYDVT